MISTISQHKINTNCLNQYNKNFQKLSLVSPNLAPTVQGKGTNILKSIFISLVPKPCTVGTRFGKTLILGKSLESLPARPLSSDLKKNKTFATGKKLSSKGKSHSSRFLLSNVGGKQRGPLIKKKLPAKFSFHPRLLVLEITCRLMY